MLKLRMVLLYGVIIMVLGICGCSIESKEVDINEMYSRTDTKFMSESASFGKGKSDDIYTALAFIYSSESIQIEHGSDFEITPEDVTCYTSEGQTHFFPWLYTGQAEYSFSIDESIYKVKLSKPLFGIWTVTECVLE